MAKVDFSKLANGVVQAVGGTGNIQTVTHCATRLRFVLKDESIVDQAVVEGVEGVLGVAHGSGQYQVIIGNRVSLAYEEICKIPGIKAGGSVDVVEKDDLKVKGNVFDKLVQTISGVFTPMLMAMCGAGMLKGILALLVAIGVTSESSGLYTVLFAAGDALFRYLPLLLAVTAAEKFGANKYVALAIVGAMLYPSIVGLEAGTTFLGIPLSVMDYHSTVLPAIFVIYVLSKLEKLLKKVLPDAAYMFVMPCICLVIMVPVSLLVIGPVLNAVSGAMAAVYTAINNISPLITGILVGGFWNVLVIFGVHWGFVPVMLNNISVFGYDTLCPLVGPANFTIAGAVLGVFLKSKINRVKTVAGSAAVSGLLGGIVEPGLYGVCLRYKKIFGCAVISGIVGGCITALAGARSPAVTIPGLFTLPAFIGPGFVGMVIGIVVTYVLSAVLSFIVYNDNMETDR